MIIKLLFLILLIYIFYNFNLDYKICYTIDYLLNRNSYIFSEESQFTNNKFINKNNFFTNYLKLKRQKKLISLKNVETQKVIEIDFKDLNSCNIVKLSSNFTQPFVIRGLIKDFECVQKWDLDYFEKEYGDIEVLAFSENNRISYTDNGNIFKKCNDINNLCSIRNICQGIKNGEPVYVNNISTLFTVNKEAQKELNLDKIKHIINNSFLKKNKNVEFLSQLFLGGNNTGTTLHCSSNINFFFNIKGEKKWGFIDPKYTELINCQTSKNGLFSACLDDYFLESDDNAFVKIPRSETVLKSGDLLFNPAWYWHAVKNISEYTIAVANRYKYDYFDEIPIINNNKFFSFLQLFSLNYYLKFTDTNNNLSFHEKYAKIIDQEIINNVSKVTAIK